MKNQLSAIIAVTLLLLTMTTAASPLVSTGKDPQWVLPHATWWHDPSALVDAAAMAGGDYDGQFKPLPGTGLAALPGNQWLRFEVNNQQRSRSQLVLVIESLMVADLELVYRDTEGKLHDYRTGRNVPFHQRPIESRFLALPLAIPPGATQTVYVKANMVINTPARPYVITELGLLERTLAGTSLALMLAGIVIGVTLYMLLLSGLTHEWRDVGWYAGSMVCGALVLLAHNGHLARFTDGNPFLQLSAIVPLAALERAFSFQFIRSLFQTSHRYPLLDRCLRALVVVALLGVVFHFTLDSARLILWNRIVSMFLLAALIAISLYLAWRRDAQARLFLIGLACYLTLHGMYILVVSHVLPFNAFTRHTIELASLVLALTYTLLLSDKLRRYRSENFRLETAAAVAQAGSRAKSELLAIMSHEIRTPMNGVLGMVELLQGTRLDETQRRYANTIQSSGKTLLTVINDILDFSKVEAGKLTLAVEPFDLAELIEEVVAPFRASSTRAVILIASVAPDTPTRLVGDPIRLQQVIGNLLNNAFKFTERGEVRLRIEPLAVTSQRVQLNCAISDTGIGIDNEGLQRLFQPFSQVEGAGRRFGGTGLGLTICQRLVGMMGGRIDVASELGQGSTFRFDVWLERNPTPAMPNTDMFDPAGLHLLAVDDREEYLWILQEQAAALGMTVTVVNQPAQAVAAARAEPRPDLIAIDLDMPGIDGFELGRQLAAEPQVAAIPRLLLTASCTPPGPRELGLSAFTAAYSKPTSAPQLRAMLNAVLDRRQRAAAPTDIRQRRFDGVRVLVAEDNPVNRQVIEAMLSRLGVDIAIAADGLEALAMATQRDFDLILMDCEMPNMDGYRASRHIRQHERASGRRPVAIVALSAHAMPEYRQRSLAAGMDEHLAKPISIAALEVALARYAVRTRQA